MRLSPMFLNQHQAYHHASDGCDDGEVTGDLGGGTSAGPMINARYGQERRIGGQQHSSLSEQSVLVML